MFYGFKAFLLFVHRCCNLTTDFSPWQKKKVDCRDGKWGGNIHFFFEVKVTGTIG